MSPTRRPAILGYRCLACLNELDWGPTLYECPACHQNVEVVFDTKRLATSISAHSLARSRLPGHWRFLPLLPLETPPPTLARRSPPASPLASVGLTPMYRSRGLEKRLGVGPIYIKDEGRNPSGSLKDRASSVVLARALEEEATVVCGASTGNAGASLACMGASTGSTTVLFVPKTAPPAKVAQLVTYGARVVLVDGSYDTCYDLCTRVCREKGWHNRNTGANPITREGKKTCAFEIALDLGLALPDLVLVPVGDGNILSGLAKGFVELAALGITRSVPKLVAVQSERSNAIARAFANGGRIQPVRATTRADSISVDLPRDGVGALVALKRTEGFPVEVTDEEILDAIGVLGREEGVFAEPAGAASLAGLTRLVREGRLRRDRTVVIVVTGSGLKDVAAALSATSAPPVIPPEMAAVERALAGLEATPARTG